jgi:hypothetical protein
MLYSDRTLVDGWDKMASIHSMADFPYYKRRREMIYRAALRRNQETAKFEEQIIHAIREQGPLSSLAFKDHEQGSQKMDWWWAPTNLARATMESLFWKDALGIAHKVNTRRVFDLAENLYPDHLLHASDPFASDEDYKDWHALRRLGSMGLADLRSREYWFGTAALDKAPVRRKAIQSLVEREMVIEVSVEGLTEILFMRASDLPQMDEAVIKRAPKAKAAFIAPLDNFMWNRDLIENLFDFNYVWEVYKPPKDREYGYYTLPVLYGDQIVARVDGKLDRKTRILTINGWWWQPQVIPDEAMLNAIQTCMKEFGAYLEVNAIQAGDAVDKKDAKWVNAI